MSPGAIGLRRARRAGAVAVLACGCATGLDPLERRVEDLDRRAGEMSAQVERAARDAALASRAADSAAADARAAAARAEDSSSVSRRVLSPAAPLPAHEVARGADSRARSRLAGSALRRERTQAAPLSLDDLAVVGSRRYADVFFEHYGVNPTIDTAEEPTSSFSVDVDTASYALARSYLERGELPPAEAIRVEELVNAFDYGYSTQQGAVFTVHGELAPSPTRPGYHVLDLAIRTPPVEDRARKPANLVFVIDVSGSMSLDDRLGLVKRSLRLLVDRLAPSDTIGVVVYGDRGRDVLEPAPLAERERILATIDSLWAEGSTNAQEGLELGYAMAERHLRAGATNRVVLCSDGVANDGMATTAEALFERVRAQAARGITLSTVGFGFGNYNDVLMERLAQLGNGNYSFVDNERAARRIVDRELTGWLQVAAKDVKLSLELDPAAVSRYRLIGYENRHLMAPDFANDRVDAGEVGAGQAVTALYELKLAAPTPRQLGVFRIRFEDPDGGSSRLVETSLTTDGLRPTFERASPPMRLAATVAAFAEKLRGSYWARAVRYDDLLDRIETLGPPLSERAEVIELRRAMVLARGLDHRDDRFDADSPAATMGFDEVPILR